MAKKWLDREGPKWVEQRLIDEQQLRSIQALYSTEKSAVSLLPLLASILIALSILTFIAANWQWLAPEWRLLILIVLMSGLYWSGFRLAFGEQRALGIGLISLGLISFGGSLILIGQTYSLVAFHATTFIIWGAVGICLAYLFRSRFLYLISLILLHVAQVYSSSVLHSYSYLTAILLIGGLGYYGWRYRDAVLSWFFAASVVFQFAMWVSTYELGNLWIFVCFAGLYALSDWLPDRASFYPLRVVSLAGSFITIVILVTILEPQFIDFSFKEWTAGWSVFAPLLLLFLILSLFGKTRERRLKSSYYEWLMFVPFLFLQVLAPIAHIFYLAALFVYSLYLLLEGYDEQRILKVNVGTALFLLSSFVAYSKLTWAVLDKSLFFLLGGLILFALSWFLNRRKKQYFGEQKEQGGESS